MSPKESVSNHSRRLLVNHAAVISLFGWRESRRRDPSTTRARRHPPRQRNRRKAEFVSGARSSRAGQEHQLLTAARCGADDWLTTAQTLGSRASGLAKDRWSNLRHHLGRSGHSSPIPFRRVTEPGTERTGPGSSVRIPASTSSARLPARRSHVPFQKIRKARRVRVPDVDAGLENTHHEFVPLVPDDCRSAVGFSIRA